MRPLGAFEFKAPLPLPIPSLLSQTQVTLVIYSTYSESFKKTIDINININKRRRRPARPRFVIPLLPLLLLRSQRSSLIRSQWPPKQSSQCPMQAGFVATVLLISIDRDIKTSRRGVNLWRYLQDVSALFLHLPSIVQASYPVLLSTTHLCSPCFLLFSVVGLSAGADKISAIGLLYKRLLRTMALFCTLGNSNYIPSVIQTKSG